MATSVEMARVVNLRNEYSENLLKPASMFNDAMVWNLTGPNPENGEVSQNTSTYFKSSKSLRVRSVGSANFTASSPTDIGCTIPTTGNYIFSLRINHTPVTDSPIFTVNIFRNAVLYYTLFTPDFEESIPGVWNCYFQQMPFTASDVITISFTYGSSGAETIFVDGLKLELDDKILGIPTEWTHPKDFCCGDDKVHISETQWDVTDIGPQVVTNGSSLNLLTLINNVTHKNATNSDVYDQLNIVSNSIKTTYSGCKKIHTIRISFNIIAGSDQFYQMQVRRTIDNTVVYRLMVQRNADETIQTVELTTRTLSAIDPFVVDGFYLAFVNNSGASATLDDALTVLVISHYQKGLTP